MAPSEWFIQAMEDARTTWREGISNDQEFAKDCADIAFQYISLEVALNSETQ